MAQSCLIKNAFEDFNLTSEYKTKTGKTTEASLTISPQEDIIGNGENQIPYGAIIKSAYLNIAFKTSWKLEYNMQGISSHKVSYLTDEVKTIEMPKKTPYTLDVCDLLTKAIASDDHNISLTFTFKTNIYSGGTKDVTTTTYYSDLNLTVTYDVPTPTYTITNNKDELESKCCSYSISITPMSSYKYETSMYIGSTKIGDTKIGTNILFELGSDYSSYINNASYVAAKIRIDTIDSSDNTLSTIYAATDKDGETICLTVPSNKIPSLSINDNYEVGNYDTRLNKIYVLENKTTCNLKATFTKADDSDISNIKYIYINNVRYSVSSGSTSYTYSFIPSSSSTTIKMKVEDGRGATSTLKQITITAYSYSAPSISGLSIQRCDNKGNVDQQNGLYIKITGAISYTETIGDFTNKISSATVKFTKNSETSKLYDLNTSDSDSPLFASYDKDKDYTVDLEDKCTVLIKIKDNVGGYNSYSYSIDTAKIFMRWDPNNFSFGFGAYPEEENEFRIGSTMKLYAAGNSTLKGACTFNGANTFNSTNTFNAPNTFDSINTFNYPNTFNDDCTFTFDKDTNIAHGIYFNYMASVLSSDGQIVKEVRKHKFDGSYDTIRGIPKFSSGIYIKKAGNLTLLKLFTGDYTLLRNTPSIPTIDFLSGEGNSGDTERKFNGAATDDADELCYIDDGGITFSPGVWLIRAKVINDRVSTTATLNSRIYLFPDGEQKKLKFVQMNAENSSYSYNIYGSGDDSKNKNELITDSYLIGYGNHPCSGNVVFGTKILKITSLQKYRMTYYFSLSSDTSKAKWSWEAVRLGDCS